MYYIWETERSLRISEFRWRTATGPTQLRDFDTDIV